MTENKKTAPPKVSRHRSPNYPSIGLAEAIERSRTLQAQGATKHFIPLKVAFDSWNLKSAAGNRIAAALEAYELAVTEGKTEKREIKLTETARRILLDAPEKPALLKKAALKPALHAELWKKYEGDPPADAVIKNYLLVEREFNPNSVDRFISQFRRTIKFAELATSGKLAEEEEEEDKEANDHETEMEVIDQSQQAKGAALPPAPRGQLPFPLYLSKTQKASLYVPGSMTRKEFELLKRQIEHSLTVMEATILADDEPTES